MRRKLKGFTLIEILVVMLIIALASGLIVLKVGNSYLSNKNTDVFAKELVSRIQLAQKQAIFSMNVLGLEIGAGRYSFAMMANTREIHWNLMGGNDTFWAARAIPKDIIVNYQAQSTNKTVLFQNGPSPQIIIYPSGELTPFTITIHSLGKSKLYTIVGTSAGNITFKESD